MFVERSRWWKRGKRRRNLPSFGEEDNRHDSYRGDSGKEKKIGFTTLLLLGTSKGWLWSLGDIWHDRRLKTRGLCSILMSSSIIQPSKISYSHFSGFHYPTTIFLLFTTLDSNHTTQQNITNRAHILYHHFTYYIYL